MLEANGHNSLDLKDRFGGMWVVGSGPDAAKFVRLSAVIIFRITTSCVASTYKALFSGKVIGSSLSVPFVVVL